MFIDVWVYITPPAFCSYHSISITSNQSSVTFFSSILSSLHISFLESTTDMVIRLGIIGLSADPQVWATMALSPQSRAPSHPTIKSLPWQPSIPKLQRLWPKPTVCLTRKDAGVPMILPTTPTSIWWLFPSNPPCTSNLPCQRCRQKKTSFRMAAGRWLGRGSDYDRAGEEAGCQELCRLAG